MSKTKLLSLIFICLVLLSVIFIAGKSKKTDVMYYTKTEAAKEAVLQENEHLYFSDKAAKEMTKVHSSEMTRLYFDKEKGGIAVYDTVSKKLWRSIPEIYAGVKTGNVSVEVISKGAVYTLYSLGDSAVQSEIGENFVKVLYNFDTTLANKEKVKISLPVTFTLKNGTLYAETDCSVIEASKGIVLKSVSILPFFGADREKNEGDYLLVPDGCGATIDLSENPKEFPEINLPVYGEDISTAKTSNKKALIGTYGMKKGVAAFVAVIENGAELARIKANKALSKDGLNSVGAYFEITPTAETEDGKLAVSKKSYKGKIAVSYRFLSAQNADYIGMASAVREVLIRNGSLPMSPSKAEGEYPFNLSIIGVGYDKVSNQNRILTSYSQTFDILSSLKAKGIGGINLRYRGLFEGGINQRDISNADFALGNTNELSELTRYAKAQNINLFADVNLISSSVKGSFDSKALSILGEYTKKEPESFEMYESNFLSPDEIVKTNSLMLSKLRDSAFEGICFGAEGKYLYSDFAKGTSLLRNETATFLSSQLASASANKKLMIDTGNLYAVKYASSVVNLPSVSSCKNTELCTAVPFIQAVYHGFFDYSLTPINTANVSETMFLRSVEFGAVPYFEWYYTDNSDEENKDKYCYTNSINDAQLYYQRMSSSLSDLRNARITAHEKVKKNVYMTEYEGSTKIYVNYNKKAVTVSGVTIEPRSFVRVN